MNEAIRKICSRLIVFASAVLLMSCTHESTEIFDQKSNSIRLSYSFNHITSTKALATGSENAISEIGLMFYDTGTDAYVANVVVEVNSSGEPTGQADFVTPKPLLENTTYKVLAFAKGSAQFSGDQTMENYLTSCASKDYEKMKLDASIGNLQRISTPLSFCGETTFIKKGVLASPISVVLTRSVAKITLRNGAGNLHVKWAKTAMYRTEGYLYHQQLYPGKINHGADGVTGVSPSEQHISEKLYAYPNMVGVTKQNDDKTTCLLVAAYYNADGDWGGTPPVDSKLTYYRVNIARGSGSSQLLKRNNVYNVTINSAAGAGSETEDDALNAPDNKLNTSINDWEEDNDGSVITDPNGNYIRISNSNLVMQPAANDIKTVTIEVKPGTYWMATLKSGSAYFSAVKDPDNPNKLKVTTLQDGHATDTRRGVVEITVFNSINDQQITNLVANINLMQFPKSMEVSMLSVDGKIAPFKIEAPKTGDNYFYEVITGSSAYSWVAVSEGDVSSWINFTPSGGNGSLLNIKISRNGTVGRAAKITVHFDGNGDNIPDVGDGVPAPIDITINQERIDNDITLVPSYGAGNSLETCALNLLGGNYIEYKIKVTTSDPEIYPFCRVESNFQTSIASVYSVNAGIPTTISNSCQIGSEAMFGLLIYNAAPNRSKKSGTITITMLDIYGRPVAGKPSYSFPVILDSKAAFPTPVDETSVEGHAWISIPGNKRLYVYDRNHGAASIADYPVAKYYTSASPHINSQFAGKVGSLNIALYPTCPEGWGPPEESMMSYFVGAIHYGEGIGFFVSDEKDMSGSPIVTYFSPGIHWERAFATPADQKARAYTIGADKTTLQKISVNTRVLLRCVKLVDIPATRK